jgi:hypothetical protein
MRNAGKLCAEVRAAINDVPESFATWRADHLGAVAFISHPAG